MSKFLHPPIYLAIGNENVAVYGVAVCNLLLFPEIHSEEQFEREMVKQLFEIFPVQSTGDYPPDLQDLKNAELFFHVDVTLTEGKKLVVISNIFPIY